jgi:energy-coupling factor transporter transmembrane protein EcfT
VKLIKFLFKIPLVLIMLVWASVFILAGYVVTLLSSGVFLPLGLILWVVGAAPFIIWMTVRDNRRLREARPTDEDLVQEVIFGPSEDE